MEPASRRAREALSRLRESVPRQVPLPGFVREYGALDLATMHDESRELRPKFRSGQPPPAPASTLSFAQAAADPQIFRQRIKRVQAWQLRACHWAPVEKHGLMLMEVVSGDVAMVLQEEPLEKLQQERWR